MTETPFGLSTIGQILVPVRNAERATAFYRDALGLPFLFAFPHMAFFDADGVRLYLSEPESADFRGKATLYFTRARHRGGGGRARGPRRRLRRAAERRPSRPVVRALDVLHEGSRRQQHRPDVRGPDRAATAGAFGGLPPGADASSAVDTTTDVPVATSIVRNRSGYRAGRAPAPGSGAVR